MGSFTVELYFKHAPKTVENFTRLADRGYYDGTVFHRVIRDFSEPAFLLRAWGLMRGDDEGGALLRGDGLRCTLRR